MNLTLGRHCGFGGIAILAASLLLLTGCTAVLPNAEPPSVVEASSPEDSAAERAAMECVTGAWVAETAAIQSLINEEIRNKGITDQELIVEGSIVYEFLEHGFGLTVIPTAFALRMPTGFGDVVGSLSGQATGMWGLNGERITAVGESWQMGFQWQWRFNNSEFDVDTGTQSIAGSFTDINYFTCSGDSMILQSMIGPPLQLVRMTEVP